MMKKKVILIFSGRLGKGGAERFTSNFISFLDQDKYDIHLCLGYECIEYNLPKNVTIHTLDNTKSYQFPRTVFRFRKLILRIKPDIIFSTIGQTNRFTAFALTGLKDSPTWIMRVGNNPTKGGRSDWRNALNKVFNKLAFNKSDHIVVNSYDLQRIFAENFPNILSKTSVIYNPIDVTAISMQAERPANIKKDNNHFLLIHVGRFHRQKRHDILLKSFAVLLEKNLPKKVDLWLCGEGYLQNVISQQIKDLNLTESVHVLGHCIEPFPLIKQADLLLLTSDWEGMPNVLIEAMVIGTPVVSTNCRSGPRELIEQGKTGYLANVCDPQDIANNIGIALSNENISEISINAQKRAALLFNDHTNMKKWQELFKRFQD